MVELQCGENRRGGPGGSSDSGSVGGRPICSVRLEHGADRISRQAGFRHEPEGGARLEEILEVVSIVRGDDDEPRRRVGPRCEAASDVEAALISQVDVDEGDVWAERPQLLDRLTTCRRDADDLEAFALESGSGRSKEILAVVDDQKAHPFSIAARISLRIPASRNLSSGGGKGRRSAARGAG